MDEWTRRRFFSALLASAVVAGVTIEGLAGNTIAAPANTGSRVFWMHVTYHDDGTIEAGPWKSIEMAT